MTRGSLWQRNIAARLRWVAVEAKQPSSALMLWSESAFSVHNRSELRIPLPHLHHVATVAGRHEFLRRLRGTKTLNSSQSDRELPKGMMSWLAACANRSPPGERALGMDELVGSVWDMDSVIVSGRRSQFRRRICRRPADEVITRRPALSVAEGRAGMPHSVRALATLMRPFRNR